MGREGWKTGDTHATASGSWGSRNFPCTQDSTLSFPWQFCGRFFFSVDFLPSPNTIALGIIGFLLVADAAKYGVVFLQRRRRSKRQPQSSCDATHGVRSQSVSPGEMESEKMVRHYWEQLSDAILKAPRTPPGKYNRCQVVSNISKVASHVACIANGDDNNNNNSDDGDDYALPEAVRLLWEDRVRYILDEREVFTLLRRSAMTNDNGKRYALPAAAALALLWRLQLVRSVGDILVDDRDVVHCRSELDDLQMHSKSFFLAFIHPLEEQKAIFTECWVSLSAEERQLWRQRRALQARNMWSLAKYVYAGGRGKLVSCAMMGVLTAVAARSASAGLVVRDRVERVLFSSSPSILPSTSAAHNSCFFSTARGIASLLVFEWVRLVITSAVMHVTQDYIRASASRHRDCVKMRVYEALAYTPLSFFDTHNLDSVEELLYYTNDLEGVDVHMHDFFARVVRAVTALMASVAVLDSRSTAVVCETVLGSALLTGAMSILRKRCMTLAFDADAEGCTDAPDAEELENGGAATDGLMLRGMEIIEHVHELRPYAADTALMSWWIAHTAHYRQRPAGLWHVLHLALRLRFVWAIDAFTSIVKWLLPVAVVAHAAATCQTQGVLLEAMRAMQEMLGQVADTRRVVEVVLSNAYKANALESILDVQHWEDEGVVPPVTVDVCAIRAEGLQFQYPTAPTVNAFPSPATFCLQLQDETTGTGRLVCVTGRSGCGKTTLLRLLLALYTTPQNSCLMLKLRRRRNTADSDPSQDGSDDTTEWLPVSSISPTYLRSTLFSYVPQTATFFPGATIAQNVSLQNHVSLTNASLLSRVHACTEAVGCGDFISRLPQGLLTQLSVTTGWVTPDAVRPSCGQGQRLMLARALFHGGGVLLMDEPTAGLDSESKWAVMAKWRELLCSRRLHGVVCVTHDADVLQRADQIVQL